MPRLTRRRYRAWGHLWTVRGNADQPVEAGVGSARSRLRFVFAAEARDRPGLATCRRHLDIEGAVALRRYLECRDCHTRQYAATTPQRNLFILDVSPQVRMEYVTRMVAYAVAIAFLALADRRGSEVRGMPRRLQQTVPFSRCGSGSLTRAATVSRKRRPFPHQLTALAHHVATLMSGFRLVPHRQ